MAAAAIASLVITSGMYGVPAMEPEDVTGMEQPEGMDAMEPAGMSGMDGPDDRITVFASFYPYYEFARNVAGDSARVVQFLPAGVEAHDWDPSAGDLESLRDASVFVYGGLGMESYVDRLKDSGEFDNVVFLSVSDGVDLLELGADAHDHGHDEDGHGKYGNDPHTWLDPVRVAVQVANIRDGLAAADPGSAEQYEGNAAEYIAKLNALDARIEEGLSSCGRDTFVPFHNAFAYFGDRYGLEIVSLGGLAADSEATASEIAQLVDYVRDNEINVIFSEDLVDPRLAEVIADEAGARVMLLSPIEAITGEEAGRGTTYIEKMDQNLKALRTALECP